MIKIHEYTSLVNLITLLFCRLTFIVHDFTEFKERKDMQLNFDAKMGSSFPVSMLPGPMLWPPSAAAFLPPSFFAAVKPPSPQAQHTPIASQFKRPWETDTHRPSVPPHPLLLQQGKICFLIWGSDVSVRNE